MKHILLLMLPALTWAYDWGCNLHCYNNGACKHGRGQFGSYAGVMEDEEMPWEANATQQIGMFCSCPVGYTGLQCEIKMKVCGEDGQDEHTCFNGSECKKDRSGNGKIFYRCECDAANSVMDKKYAGKYCEHISTVFCHHSKHGTTNAFCTNGGKCRADDDPTPGFCECTSGWTGDHCEINSNSGYTVQNLVSDATSAKNIGRIFGFCCIAVFAVLGFLYWRDLKRAAARSKRRRRAQEMAQTSSRGEFM